MSRGTFTSQVSGTLGVQLANGIALTGNGPSIDAAGTALHLNY